MPCDVEVYASGLRNAYDFVFHSNGLLYFLIRCPLLRLLSLSTSYSTDNGLGVTGTVPPIANNYQHGIVVVVAILSDIQRR